jgi:hypothetical protein
MLFHSDLIQTVDLNQAFNLFKIDDCTQHIIKLYSIMCVYAYVSAKS